jgi:hypothetical protein
MNAFLKKINVSWKYRLFLFFKLPAAYFSGLKLILATEQTTLITIPYKFLTKNPFKSMYFASQSMAAEMCSGILSMANINSQKTKVSMLVVHFEAAFYKKATGLISFTCNDGIAIKEAVAKSIETGEGVLCKTTSIGTNNDKEIVSKFTITWSYKAKKTSKA